MRCPGCRRKREARRKKYSHLSSWEAIISYQTCMGEKKVRFIQSLVSEAMREKAKEILKA